MESNCSVCKHPIRSSRAKVAEYPGTRRSHGGKCSVCYRNPMHLSDEALFRREQAKNSLTCLSCKKPMRPQKTRSSEYPGTVEKAMHGKCNSCYKRGGYTGRSFVQDTDIMRLDAMPTPVLTENDYRIVRRLIQERFDGDDYLLHTLGLVGEDV